MGRPSRRSIKVDTAGRMCGLDLGPGRIRRQQIEKDEPRADNRARKPHSRRVSQAEKGTQPRENHRRARGKGTLARGTPGTERQGPTAFRTEKHPGGGGKRERENRATVNSSRPQHVNVG